MKAACGRIAPQVTPRHSSEHRPSTAQGAALERFEKISRNSGVKRDVHDERWYETAFGRDYLTLYAHRSSAEARAQVVRILEWGFHGQLLDLGCGAGRHLAALEARGVFGVGVDLSRELLAAAPREVRPRLVRADLRRLPFRDASFDGALSLFSSFGYFDDAGDRRALHEAARVLRPAGQLLLDLADPGAVRAGLVPRSERQAGDLALVEERHLADGGRLVVKQVTAIERSGARRSWQERMRLYEPHELLSMAALCGFSVRARHTTWGASGGSMAAPRQIWVLERES